MAYQRLSQASAPDGFVYQREFITPAEETELIEFIRSLPLKALVAEYQPGTPLGWHRDVPDFGVVGGLSLLGLARMRFRPYPHRKGDRTALRLDLEPRSAYAMRGAARWNWQHAISPTRELRYSITFRTLAA